MLFFGVLRERVIFPKTEGLGGPMSFDECISADEKAKVKLIIYH